MHAFLAAAAAVPMLVAQAHAPLPASVSGTVYDANTGAPIPGVLVQQDGSVTSVFTSPEGRFTLLLDQSGEPTLSVSAVGYETQSAKIARGRALTFRLKPIAGFVPSVPLLPGSPETTGAIDTSPLNSNIGFSYRVVYEGMSDPNGAAINGFANNDLALGLRYRYWPWIVEAEGAHYNVPVDVAGLSQAENPAFTPSIWQAGLRAGYMWAFSRDLEGALELAYRYNDYVPNNLAGGKDTIAYTGSNLDWEQAHHAFGGNAVVAWRPKRAHWSFEASAGAYPLMVSWGKAPGSSIDNGVMSDLRAGASYEVFPGLRLGLSYQNLALLGNGSDVSNQISLNMFYTPAGLPRGNEQ